MVTKYIDEVENKMIKVITQKYEVGTYVAIYVDGVIAEQFGSNDPEDKFHKKIRRKLDKEKITWTNFE